MTTTIASHDVSFEPTLVLGYQTAREVPSLSHTIIGRGDPDVTLKPAGTRSGTLELFFTSEADYLAASDVLTRTSVLTLADTDYPSLGMSFVVRSISARLELDRWVVSVGYQEVRQ